MKKISNIIHWFIVAIFSILFLGFAFVDKEIIPSIIYLSGILLFIPQLQKYSFEKMSKYRVCIKIISFIIILVAGVVFSNSEAIQNENNANTTEGDIVEEKDDINEVKKYQIIESNDISTPLAKRYQIKVVMDQKIASEDLIQTISEEIIDEYKNKGSYATVIFYYMNETEIDGGYTLAKAQWSPNGIWADAHLKKDYKITYDFKTYVGQEGLKTPTQSERDITKQIRDLYYEMNNSPDSYITEKEIYIILSPKLNKTIEELEEIHTKVTFFEMGL